MDGSGDLFIADTGNNVIREVNAATHVITTVAGNGTGGYSGDNGPATAAELDRPGRGSPWTAAATCSSPTREVTWFARSTPRRRSSRPLPAAALTSGLAYTGPATGAWLCGLAELRTMAAATYSSPIRTTT